MVRCRGSAGSQRGGRRKKLSEDPEFRDAAWLVRNGVPFATAFGMDADDISTYRMPDDVRLALAVLFGEWEGGRYNWSTRTWEKQR